MHDTRLLAALLAAALLSACASTPKPAEAPAMPLASSGCDELQAALSRADAAANAAQDRQKNAWQAVVPVVVAARYASAKSDAESAARQRTTLQAQAAELACPLNPTREG